MSHPLAQKQCQHDITTYASKSLHHGYTNTGPSVILSRQSVSLLPLHSDLQLSCLSVLVWDMLPCFSRHKIKMRCKIHMQTFTFAWEHPYICIILVLSRPILHVQVLQYEECSTWNTSRLDHVETDWVTCVASGSDCPHLDGSHTSTDSADDVTQIEVESDARFSSTFR